jgi:TorA maturation chaperone TorD
MTLADAVQDATVAEEDVLRADLYDLLAALLAKPPTRDLIDRVAGLDGDDGELGRAVRALTRLARATTETAAEREFNRLFIGAARGELRPYAS